MNDDLKKSVPLCQLVEQLHEPSTRRMARRKLMAAKAIEPLLECLASTNESVVWAAVVSLGGLRATKAVEPLIQLLDRGTLLRDVGEALSRITGQHFESDAQQWRKWFSSTADSPKETPKATFDVDQCIQRTGELLGVEPKGSNGTYSFNLSLPEERNQRVTVYFGRQDTDGEELVVIYSECGPAKSKYYEAVLRKNLRIPAGAFAIRDIEGQPYFVMVDTMIKVSVSPSVLAKKIENIGSRSDSVEKSLVQEDCR